MIELGSPWLLLLAIPVAAGVIAGARVYGRVASSVKVEYPLARFIAAQPTRRWRRLRLGLKLAVLALLALALASPKVTYTVRRRARAEVEGRLKLANPAVVVLLDVSGSMGEQLGGERKIDAAVEAVRSFLRKLPGGVDVGLVAFSSHVVKAVPVTSDRLLVAQVAAELKAGGGTMYSYPLESAISWLEPYRVLNISCAVVLVSDGLPADRELYVEKLSKLRKLEIPVYTVYIGEEGSRGEAVARGIASETGGESFTVEDAAELASMLGELAREVGEAVYRGAAELELEEQAERTAELKDIALAMLAAVLPALWAASASAERTFF